MITLKLSGEDEQNFTKNKKQQQQANKRERKKSLSDVIVPHSFFLPPLPLPRPQLESRDPISCSLIPQRSPQAQRPNEHSNFGPGGLASTPNLGGYSNARALFRISLGSGDVERACCRS